MSEQLDIRRRFADMLAHSESWAPGQLRDYQRTQLGQLLRHARTRASFYAHRLDQLFPPYGDIDWSRWAEVPIVTRRDVTDAGAAMSTPVPAGHGRRVIVQTTGSTGAALRLETSQLASAAGTANRLRAQRWHRLDVSAPLLRVSGDDPARAAWPDGEALGPWGPAWDEAGARGILWSINRLTPYADILEFIQRKAIRYLGGGTKVCLAIALEAERIGASISLDAVLPQGSMVDEIDREAFQRVFGARTVELYSSKEAGQIAHACPSGDGLHVNAESVLLEIVDDDGQPCAPGVEGRVIVTPLFNAAQPLIRYDQGDRATFLPPCNCGRHLPRISNLIGRSTAVFYHPDGRARAAYLLGVDKRRLDCVAWQIAQTGPHDFEVRYVPRDPASMGDEAGLAARLRAVTFDDSRVSFLRVADLPLGPGGKAREYLNEWVPRNAALKGK